MVRIKHRYLLINILYPSTSTQSEYRSVSTSPTPEYLRFHAPSPAHLTPALLIRHLRESIQLHFGDHGLGVTAGSLRCVYLSTATSTAIVRCARAHYRLVWASLTLIGSLPSSSAGEPGKRCVIRVVRVSGTIRKAEEEAVRRARREIVRAKAVEEQGGRPVVGLERFVASPARGNQMAGNVVGMDDQEASIEDFDEEELEEESE